MNPNRDKLTFYTGDPIDKIVAPMVRRTITNNGSTSGQVGTWQSSRIVHADYPNPYGKRCFVRGRWSIDGGSSWNTFETHLLYNFTISLTGSFPGSQQGQGLMAAVSIGVRDDIVRIRTANGHHGTVTINTDNNNQSYSPISKTFLIEYELFEVE